MWSAAERIRETYIVLRVTATGRPHGPGDPLPEPRAVGCAEDLDAAVRVTDSTHLVTLTSRVCVSVAGQRDRPPLPVQVPLDFCLSAPSHAPRPALPVSVPPPPRPAAPRVLSLTLHNGWSSTLRQPEAGVYIPAGRTTRPRVPDSTAACRRRVTPEALKPLISYEGRVVPRKPPPPGPPPACPAQAPPTVTQAPPTLVQAPPTST